MTRTQLARLLDELDDHWRLFFEFLAHTGLRISEAIEVRWGRDLEHLLFRGVSGSRGQDRLFDQARPSARELGLS